MQSNSLLWRRIDQPGHEAAHVRAADPGWVITGCAAFGYEGSPCQLRYEVRCRPDWHTVLATVDGWVGSEDVSLRIDADENGRWRLNGADCASTEGCVDVDLNFSPCTNLLPIRRLQLSIEESAHARAAWLRFPDFSLEPLDQIYRRVAADVYRYESGDGSLIRDLRVNDFGLITEYPGFWLSESLTPEPASSGSRKP